MNFNEQINRFFNECAETLLARNSDYTNDDPNPFSNLESCQELFDIDPRIGLKVRIADKFKRSVGILNKMERGELPSMQLKDAIIDQINFWALTYIYELYREAGQGTVHNFQGKAIESLTAQVATPDFDGWRFVVGQNKYVFEPEWHDFGWGYVELKGYSWCARTVCGGVREETAEFQYTELEDAIKWCESIVKSNKE